MHKRNIILLSFLAIMLSFFCLANKSASLKAKEESTNDFIVTIGNDNDIWPTFENNGDATYTLNFSINIKGRKEEAGPKFQWINKMYYFVNGTYYEEIDKTTDENHFEVNEQYSYNIFDEHMPTYVLGEAEPINKIYFVTTFKCVNCNEGDLYENYEYPIQETSVFELNVKYDYTKPIFCENESECSYPNGGTEINNVAFKFMITDKDSGLNLNSLKYGFLTDYNPTPDKLTNTLLLGQEFYYTPDRKDLINSEQVYESVFLYVYAQDLAGNYIFYKMSSDPYRYNYEKLDNNLNYQNTSEIPDQDKYYKSISIKIDYQYDMYYVWNGANYPFAEAKQVKEQGTIYDKENGIQYTSQYTGIEHLIVVSFHSEEEFTFMILSYKFDNLAPIIDTSSYPSEDNTYQNVTLKFTFKDNYGELGKAYYTVTQTALSNEQINSINLPYEQGTDLTVGNNLDGKYYIYFIIYDTLDNYRYYYLNYTFDNTAPILTLSVTEEDALKVSNGKNIKIIVNELKEKNFKCKWALSNLTLTEDNLDAICTNGSNIDVPKNSEGYYKLWAFLEDEVGNKTLYSSYPFLVDSIGPSITVDILYEDEVYRNNNEIVISSTDNYSGISLIIYDWFPYNQTVIDGTRFRYSNLEEINYPDNIYGQYALWVYSKDGANNATLQKVANKFLIDTEKFTLSLKGKEIIKIVKKEKFVDPGVVALKGSREMNYEVVSNLNENKPGEYMITYKLDNLEISRKVIVQSTSKYYYIIGISVLAGITTSLIPFNKIRKKRD